MLLLVVVEGKSDGNNKETEVNGANNSSVKYLTLSGESNDGERGAYRRSSHAVHNAMAFGEPPLPFRMSILGISIISQAR